MQDIIVPLLPGVKVRIIMIYVNDTHWECPTGCSACDNETLCTDCKAGYIFENNLCEPCPDGKYRSGPQTCTGKFSKKMFNNK